MGSTLLTVPPLALEFTGSTTPAAYGVRNGHRMVKFGDTGNTEAFYSNFMPEGYVGSNLSVTIAWMAESAVAGDVDWDVAFERLAAGGQDLDSDGFAASVVSVSNTTNAVSGALNYTTIVFTNPQADGLQPNEKFRIRLRRLGDNVTDTMSGNAEVTDVSFNQTAFSGTLTVTEQDGVPSVTGVRTIKFDNATVTDEGGDVVSVASGGGGGGGFFSDGTGVDAAIGKGSVTAPLAAGANCFASGDESKAGRVGTLNSFAWGFRAFAMGDDAVAIGQNVGYNDYDLLTAQVQGPSQSFFQGLDIKAASWSKNLFFQGTNIKMTNDTYGPQYPLIDYGSNFPQFAVGRDIQIEHSGYYYSAGDYYYGTGLAFVFGSNHVLTPNSEGREWDNPMVCIGRNNTLLDSGGWVFGMLNTVTSGGNKNNPTTTFVFGHENTINSSTNQGNWHFLRDTILNTATNWFTWGYTHTNGGATTKHRNVFLGGRNHKMQSIPAGEGGTSANVFLWGTGGNNGQVKGNHNLFGWSVEGAAATAGRSQKAFVLGQRQTTDATANQLLTRLFIDNTRALNIRIEVTAYDTVNNNQAALFHSDNILGYRSAHTGAPILLPAGPIALTSVNLGGGSATWTASLVVNGLDGFDIVITGAAATTIRWTGRISFLTAGA